MSTTAPNVRPAHIDFDSLKRLCEGRVEVVVRALVDPDAKVAGAELWFADPRKPDTKRDSASINLRSGKWHCRATGGSGGDVVSLVALAKNVTNPEAANLVAETLGMAVPLQQSRQHSGRRYSRFDAAADRVSANDIPTQEPAHEKPPHARAEPAAEQAGAERLEPAFAGQLFERAQLIAGTIAEAYLSGRGLDPRSVADNEMRFDAARPYVHGKNADGSLCRIATLPAVLFPLRYSPDGQVVALLRVYIDESGQKARIVDPDGGAELTPKKLTGAVGNAAVWFGSPVETLLLCEGPEDAIALRMATGLPVMASCSWANMGRATLPPSVKTLIVVPDDNSDKLLNVGERGLERAVAAYSPTGVAIKVVRLSGGKDANELLIADGLEALAFAVAHAQPYEPLHAGGAGGHERATETPSRAVDDDEGHDGEVSDVPKLDRDVLDIPGGYGDLACYLRERDPTGDPVKALALATAAMMALTGGAYQFDWGQRSTCTDLYIVLVDASGGGKTSGIRYIDDLLVRVAEGHPETLQTFSVLGTLGSAEGYWDLLTDVANQRRLCAATFAVDEFGDELRQMGSSKGYKFALGKLLRDLTNAGNSRIKPPPLSQRSKSAPREPIHNAVISLFAATTRDQFMEALADDAMLRNGLEARFLVFAATPTGRYDGTSVPEPVDLVDGLRNVWKVAARVATSTQHSAMRPPRVRLTASQIVLQRICTIEKSAHFAAQKTTGAGGRWGPLINRRVEHTVKLAMLYAISQNPEAPEITCTALSWAERVVAFKEDGHRALRDGHVTMGERAKEEAGVTDRVLRAIERHEKRRGPGRPKKSVEFGMPARHVAKNMNLSKEQLARAVDNLLHRGEVYLFDGGGKQLQAYPREAAAVFLTTAKKKFA